jgi:hypothetical protein
MQRPSARYLQPLQQPKPAGNLLRQRPLLCRYIAQFRSQAYASSVLSYLELIHLGGGTLSGRIQVRSCFDG